MLIQSLQVGIYGTNCYLLTDSETLYTAVIDPGAEPERILKSIKDGNMKVKYILLTHAHFDHIGAVIPISEATGAPVYLHKMEMLIKNNEMQRGLPSEEKLNFFEDGDILPLGSLKIEIMHTPGHSPGSCVFKVNDVLFSGDTLFCDSCGRTDFEGGSFPLMMKSLKRLYELSGDYAVYPGHERSTRLDRERKVNYYMREAVER